MLVWCMKCKKKQSIARKYFIKTRFNKYLVRGECPICDSKMSSLISKAHYDKEKE